MGKYEAVTVSGGGGRGRGLFADRPQLPYLLPFLAFVGIMLPGTLSPSFGVDWQRLWYDYLPVVYATKTLAAAVLLWWLWKYYTPIKWGYWGVGALVGVLGVVEWVAAVKFGQMLGIQREVHDQWRANGVYNPVEMIRDPMWRYLFYVVRVGGPTLVVPVMEELLFRDFMMRALIRGARFDDVDVGTFSWMSLIGMSLAFGANHGLGIDQGGMFIAGVGYGLMMGLLLIRTKSLGACIVAHGVTNLVLYAGWAIPRGDWQFM